MELEYYNLEKETELKDKMVELVKRLAVARIDAKQIIERGTADEGFFDNLIIDLSAIMDSRREIMRLMRH